MGIPIHIPLHDWRQVGGDMDPGAHGGIIAMADGNRIEIREIQPTRECVGDAEAREVGFPFWSREAAYDAADLNTDDKDVKSAMDCFGLTVEDLLEMSEQGRATALAEALLRYGVGVDEGPAGWAEDVVPGDVEWWGSEGPVDSTYLEDEDETFRTEVLGASEDT